MDKLNGRTPEEWWSPKASGEQDSWTVREAAHLLRRSGFGGTVNEVDRCVARGLESAIDNVFDRSQHAKYDAEMATAGRLVSSGTDARSLTAWWLLRMVDTPCPIVEKMTLFWHGHFATGADKVNNANAMYVQNTLLREHAFAPYGQLVHKISRDVAMLIYLDSEDNRKTRPNENYARELMELFCLGPGNYTERDIKEVARAFTGWEIRRGKFNFNRYQHDAGTKKFLGTEGAFDGDQAIDVVLQQPAAARFIARKLIRFFVFDEQPMSDDFVEPVANVLRESKFDIEKTLRFIFRSRCFYSELAYAQKIKSPVELAIGFLRTLGATVNMQQLSRRLERIGQLPLYPPNVKGWAGGRTWINASTILARANLIAEIVNNRKTKIRGGSLTDWARNTVQNKGGVTEWLNNYFLAAPLRSEVADALESGYGKIVEEDPGRYLSAIAALPETQLN